MFPFEHVVLNYVDVHVDANESIWFAISGSFSIITAIKPWLRPSLCENTERKKEPASDYKWPTAFKFAIKLFVSSGIQTQNVSSKRIKHVKNLLFRVRVTDHDGPPNFIPHERLQNIAYSFAWSKFVMV